MDREQHEWIELQRWRHFLGTINRAEPYSPASTIQITEAPESRFRPQLDTQNAPLPPPFQLPQYIRLSDVHQPHVEQPDVSFISYVSANDTGSLESKGSFVCRLKPCCHRRPCRNEHIV